MLRELSDLVWPSSCPSCAAVGADTAPACASCLAPLAAVPVATAPTPPKPGLPPVWAVTPYDGAVRALLLAYKEDGAHRLGRPLGAALAAALLAAYAGEPAVPSLSHGPCVVVPVPSSAAARRARGEDPTLRLVQAAVSSLRRRGLVAGLVPALRHGRLLADSAGLSAAERATNLDGALRVRARAVPSLLAAGHVLLADDVMTTGATLAEATRALAVARVAVHAAGVVAATQRWSTPGSRPGSAPTALSPVPRGG